MKPALPPASRDFPSRSRVSLSAQSGFTLIELLVVITIIGILATLAPSAISNIQRSATQLTAQSNARNIGLGLKLYASEHDGAFPSGDSASVALSKLLPQSDGSSGYGGVTKKSFFVKGSAYTKPKDNANTSDQKTLAEGENHWAMMGGLDEGGNNRWPLLFDGPASSDGKYSAKRTEKGGVWEGKSAILVRLDGSASKEPLKDLAIQTDGKDNILKADDTWATGGKLLMP